MSTLVLTALIIAGAITGFAVCVLLFHAEYEEKINKYERIKKDK